MRTSPWLAATYVAVIALGILTALPNLLSPATSGPLISPHRVVQFDC